MRRILILLVSLVLASGAVIAQSSKGTITGTITDSAGALMPGVRIEARNTETDVPYQVASSSTGTYTIAQLPPGTYQMSVSLPGFKQYTRTGISVVESQILRIDIVMVMLAADEVLTNDSIIQLLKVGIDEDLIISKIRDSQRNFDLSVQGMIDLKAGGVSDRLLRIMMDPAKATPETKAPPAPKVSAAPERPPTPSIPSADSKEPPKKAEAPAATTASDLPTEIGVFIKHGSGWDQIEPEVVVWQTGGFLRFATAGIVQGDVNGRVKGTHSGFVVRVPGDVVIVTPEGVDIAEYQLIHLRELRDAREFRTVTGGLFSSSGGATRDAVAFVGTKVASRTFSVRLTDELDPGEYGFLPTSGAVAGSSANVGKIYTFQVVKKTSR